MFGTAVAKLITRCRGGYHPPADEGYDVVNLMSKRNNVRHAPKASPFGRGVARSVTERADIFLHKRRSVPLSPALRELSRRESLTGNNQRAVGEGLVSSRKRRI